MSSNHTSKNSGFALIISLGVMSLILLLILATSAMVRVEVASAKNATDKKKARENALLAMSIAIAQLQKYAGPDQRISTRTDILEDLSGTGENPSFSSVTNPYYTAIWDVSESSSTEPGDKPTHNFREPAILVSGNEKWNMDNTISYYPKGYYHENTEINNDLSVVLLSQADPSQNILVEKQSIKEEGAYAYWVSDEGMKSRINLHNPFAATNSVISRSTSHKTSLNPFLGTAFNHEDNSSKLSRSLTRSHLNLVADSSINLQQNFYHDTTVLSHRVLSNTRSGGLKKDLSALLSNNASGISNYGNNDLLFSRNQEDVNFPATTATDNYYTNLHNPSWGKLRDYVNTGANANSSGATSLQDDSFANSRIIDMRLRTHHHHDNSNMHEASILPIMLRAQLGISAGAVTGGGAGGNDAIYMYYFPSVVLWNPYNVALKIPKLTFLFRPYTGNMDTSPSQRVGFSRFRISSGGGTLGTPDQYVSSQLRFYLPETIIPAGRAVCFSPPVGSNPMPGGNFNSTLEPQWNPDGAYYENTNISFTGTANALQIQPDGKVTDTTLNNYNNNNESLREQNNFFELFKENPNTPGDFSPSNSGLVAQFNNFSTFRGTTSLFTVNPLPIAADPSLNTLSLNGLQPAAIIARSLKFTDTNNGMSDGGGNAVPTPAGMNAETNRLNWMKHFNVRSPVHGSVNGSSFHWDNTVTGTLNTAAAPASSIFTNMDFTLDNPTLNDVFVSIGGSGGGSNSNLGRLILFDIDRNGTPITNIAQLQHANIQSLFQLSYGGWGLGENIFQSGTSYPIGNSFGSPFIERDSTYQSMNKIPVYDFSYLSNEALYDHFYASGVNLDDNYPSIFPNSRISHYGFNGIEGQRSTVAMISESASKLIVNGAFNVNSTSVEAWKSFLQGMQNTQIISMNGLQQGDTNHSPYPRLDNPVASRITSENDLGAVKQTSHIGYRALTENEISSLAEEIVTQVKIRGPFPSLSAFVNRVVHQSGLRRSNLSESFMETLHTIGLLQYSLDKTVNKTFENESTYQVNSADYPSSQIVNSSDSLFGNTSAGLPGYLLQSDLLSKFDHAITVRSDTFTIRCYGEASNSLDEKPRAKAYLEVVVQRLPKFVDDSQPAYTEHSKLNEENLKMGRKFEIISFRWMNENEI